MEKKELLEKTGMKEKEAKVLCWLFENQKGFCRDIEHDTELRQPEVSQITNHLQTKGWITHTAIHPTKKGRPQKRYMLAKSISEIIDEIQRTLTQDMEKKGVLITDLHKEFHMSKQTSF